MSGHNQNEKKQQTGDYASPSAGAEGQGIWHDLGVLERLETDGRAVTKVAGRQLALFQTAGGLYAVNNRCPHEGYPLVEGTLKDDCVLACNWHGWSFDLKTGKTIIGRDPVKTYPVERRSGRVFVHIKEVPATTVRAEAMAELAGAMAEHDYERIARSLCRFEMAGGTYEEAAIWVLNWSEGLLERGFGHAHAGLTDWISLAGSDDELRLVAFLEAFGHFAWDALFSPKVTPLNAAPTYSAEALLAAIEGMETETAVAMCRAGLEQGLGFSDIKPVLLDFVFSHYAGFGHPSIYIGKAEELIGHLGRRVEGVLCRQLVRYLCLAAREDLIPEFRLFGDLLKKPSESLGELLVAEQLSGTSVRQLLPKVAGSNSTPHEKWEALLAASALDMLKFDETLQHGVEQPIAQNTGWLDFTHAITFAESVHIHASKDPSLWRSAYMQQACFVGRNARSLGVNTFEQWRIGDIAVFFANQKAALFDMDVGEYIYGVHRLKLLTATERLLRTLSAETGELLVAALNRYLSSGLRQRHPARAAFQARASVTREG
ncbi:MAG: Rieske 2Fe-2S domain-containing protein [Kordiimonadaceae bacterium]|nr:Rieske 2Fe-2S domain-containing protein [Kordiimonadaceae bacterium]